MIEVFHFDYHPSRYIFEIYQLKKEIKKEPDINFESFQGSSEVQNLVSYRSHLESLLGDKDVFLVHPGVRAQGIVLEEFPKKFPDLKIGLITLTEEDYKLTSQVSLLSYDNIPKIMEFIKG